MRLDLAVGAAALATLAFLAATVRVAPPGPQAAAAAQQQPPDHAQLAVPVAGVARAAIRDTWGEARGGGLRAHHGTDIPAPEGTQVIAAAPGAVEKLFFSKGGGGITLYVRSADRRWSYYYAHLGGYAPGMAEGRPVKAGDLLGFVGDTGNAGAGNFHLHFGMSRMAPGDGWWQGEPVNAYPLLAADGTGG